MGRTYGNQGASLESGGNNAMRIHHSHRNMSELEGSLRVLSPPHPSNALIGEDGLSDPCRLRHNTEAPLEGVPPNDCPLWKNTKRAQSNHTLDSMRPRRARGPPRPSGLGGDAGLSRPGTLSSNDGHSPSDGQSRCYGHLWRFPGTGSPTRHGKVTSP
jgi:hypothetical protein